MSVISFDVWCQLILMFLFAFCVDDLPIGESGAFKSLAIIGLVLICALIPEVRFL